MVTSEKGERKEKITIKKKQVKFHKNAIECKPNLDIVTGKHEGGHGREEEKEHK